MTSRYAIYFSPGDSSELAEFGRRVLGREADGRVTPEHSMGYPNRQQAIAFSKTPAFYGFHATLKAPFALSSSHDPEGLLEYAEMFASKQVSMAMEGLLPRELSGGFIALAFHEQPIAIANLAEDCVRAFDVFRAPLEVEDLQKREPEKLTPRQRKNLTRFGYPYIFEEFRFHMTLTGPFLATDESTDHQTDYFLWLKEQYFSLLSTVPVLDRLCIFKQSDRTTPFTRMAEFLFDCDG